MNAQDWKSLFKFGVAVMFLLAALGTVGYILGWFESAAVVVKEEFGPEAALRKYEWFVDTSAAIEKTDADIVLFEQRRANVEVQFIDTYGADKTTWPMSVQAQYNQQAGTARDDLLAVVSNRNGIVRDYNAQSEKFNWAPFLTRDDLPPQTYKEIVVP